MSIYCPICQSHSVTKNHTGRKVAGTIGTAAGFATGLTLAANAAKTAVTVAAMSNPVTAFGGLILSGMFTSIAGNAIGSALGDKLDETVLDSHECLSCGHIFSHHQE
jgi:hypothetical protein